MPVRCPICLEAVREEGEVASRCTALRAPPSGARRCSIRFPTGDGHPGSGDAADQLPSSSRTRRRLHSTPALAEPRMGVAANVVAEIEAAKTRPLHRLLFSLGIRHVGERAARVLAASSGSIERGKVARDRGDLEIGPKPPPWSHFFEQPRNRELIRRLAEAGVRMEADRTSSSLPPSDSAFAEERGFDRLPGWTRNQLRRGSKRSGPRLGDREQETDHRGGRARVEVGQSAATWGPCR